MSNPYLAALPPGARPTLVYLVSQLGEEAGDDEVAALLAEPTEKSCPYCGRLYLKRFEALNGRCEHCRQAYVWAIEAEHPEQIQCELADYWCRGGRHGQDRVALELCPRALARRAEKPGP